MLNGKKILISSCAGLGDLLMFTPALRQIKKQYPACKITFLTNYPNKDALSGLPYIDKVIAIQRKKAFGRFRVIKDLIQQDYVIFTDWQPQLAVCAFLFGVPHRVGIPKAGHSLNKCLNKLLVTNVMHSAEYAAKTNAKLFSEALGISIEGDMTSYDVSLPTANDCKRVEQLLAESGMQSGRQFICLAPFTGMEERNWPVEYAAAFVRLVREHLGVEILLIGPPHKSEVSQQIDAPNLVGKTTVLEMVEIIRRAKLFVGPDSGPMHIAGAVGTPLIALFNKDLPSRWAPRKKCSVIKLDLPCSPCSDDTARQCETLQCMRGISPEMVFAAVQQNWQQ